MASCPATAGFAARGGAMDVMDVPERLRRVQEFIDPLLAAALSLSDEAPPRLTAALQHALLAPGKRLRPALALWAARACAGERSEADAWQAAVPAAVAVEMIHAYSLVHDDLPAMDDDDLRRGRPTCHRAFDEATAILCGDALQPLAFETLARGLPPAVAGPACLVLARAAGPEALVGGQSDDLAAERGWIDDLTTAAAAEQVAWMERVHRRKTGALFRASLALGGMAVSADPAQLAALDRFGAAFGLAFQIADDLLDAEGDEASMGKRVGKDAGRGKLTFPTVLGSDATRERAGQFAAEAADAIAVFGPAADDLAGLAHWIVSRNH
jgi:geranylgeranyl diphosphate synthase type II